MKKTFLFATVLLLFSGCIREPENIELAKYMLVQTEYNEDFINANGNVFNAYATFVMDDTKMGFVSTRTPDKKFLEETDLPGFVSPVLAAIRDKVVQIGYTRVTEEEEPDFAVNVVVLQNFNFYQTINYGYGYPGSYYGFYGYYYPFVSTYYANYVTLLIQVVDAKNPNSNNEFPIIWTAYIGDLNFTNDLTNKTLEAVNQAFLQSPYMNKN
jgi:hypothetical protein